MNCFIFGRSQIDYFLPLACVCVRGCARVCALARARVWRALFNSPPSWKKSRCSRLCVHGRAGARARSRAHRQLGFLKATSANSCSDQFCPPGCTSRRDPPTLPLTPALSSIIHGPTTTSKMRVGAFDIVPLFMYHNDVLLSVNCKQPRNSQYPPLPSTPLV